MNSIIGEAYIVHQGIFLGDEKAINRVYPEAVRAAQLLQAAGEREKIVPKLRRKPKKAKEGL